MNREPQVSRYRPDPQIIALADWLGDKVEAAQFPQHILRWRNDRWAAGIGLAELDDAAWLRHFGKFEPLSDNLPQPLALRYHGHQFRNYNPEIGDGRGFLFAQMRDAAGRLLDLGTKGSGQTPYSRDGDGRLTLKGAVREILATEMLEALGVNTSKTLSVIETGEALWRGDEPSPTRSAVLVRLSHGHIRFGTFQRLLALRKSDEMQALIAYCLQQFPRVFPSEMESSNGSGSRDVRRTNTANKDSISSQSDDPAATLLNQVVERMADMAASYMVAGFVHGVLNTDNMNISGESFDYGPWRWLPVWDGGFTAAYFDHSGLYAFGRQPEAIHWNCGQLAIALRLVADEAPLLAALERFGPLYHTALARRFCWRLGLRARGEDEDLKLFMAAGEHMAAKGIGPDAFFFAHRGGRNAPAGTFGDLLAQYQAVAGALDHPLWHTDQAPRLVIEEVESVWAAIDSDDDWHALHGKVSDIRTLGAALGGRDGGLFLPRSGSFASRPS